MPKFGAHILIAEEAGTRRPDLLGAPTNAMRLGAVGPDLTLFLFDPATKKPELRDGFDLACEVLMQIRKFKEELARIKALFDVEADALDWVSGGLSTDLTALSESALDALVLTAKLGVATGISGFNIKNPIFGLIQGGQFDPRLLTNPKYASPSILVEGSDNFGFPFRMFGHPLTDDPPWHTPAAPGDYREWWWMDLLHYRNTGNFAKALAGIAATESSEVMKQYAVGYLSHVAGDICGHPYINAIVQGPFRNHAYRHIVLEGLVDTWLWRHYGRGDILDSKLHQQIELDHTDLNRVCKQIVAAMKATYIAPMVPDMLPQGYPSWTEVRGAYNRMHIYLDLSTSGPIARPRRPPENPKDVLDELQRLLSKYSPSPPPSWNPSNPMDSILATLSYILRGVVYLAMIASLPNAYLARLATAPGRWLLYLVHLGIYLVVCGLRTLLAMMGWGYAGSDDLSTFGFLEELITIDWSSDSAYPFAGTYRPKPPFYWMIPPRHVASVEFERTVAGPFRPNTKPNWILDPGNAMDPDATRDALFAAQSPAETMRAVRQLKASGFGNAPDFLIAMLEGKCPVDNFDLDGDRGYGYKAWQFLPPYEQYT